MNKRQHILTHSLFNWRCYAIIVPFLLVLTLPAAAQQKLKTPVKLKIEDGDFEGVSVVIKNTTTGETNSVPGTSKFDLDLKLNCDYVISFSKPGYITKKIALNTNSPGDRAAQGFYPFNFEVNLFKQYDGVNIVIFNQPVGKISYNRLIDDFDYDTDYTKQIQSALKAAEDEIKQKQKEAQALAEQAKKDEAKKKLEAEAQAKADAKAKVEADKKAAEEARAQAAQAAKDKKAEEERMKREAQARMDEEKRAAATAKMEAEERAKAKAAEEEEARKAAAAQAAADKNTTANNAGGGADTRPANPAGSGNDTPPSSQPSGGGTEKPPVGPTGKSGSESPGNSPGRGTGKDDFPTANATPKQGFDKGADKAKGIEGEEAKPEPPPTVKPSPVQPIAKEPEYETLPEISVEEIPESNRTITRVTVRKNDKVTIFSRIVYKWGGVYYFRDNLSISESFFSKVTGVK